MCRACVSDEFALAKLKRLNKHCPSWAFNRYFAEPKTKAEPLQPEWRPCLQLAPRADDAENLVAQVLHDLGITAVYEPLLYPLTSDTQSNPEGFRPDFWIQHYSCNVEVTTGEGRSLARKTHRIEKTLSEHGVPTVLVAVPELDILIQTPRRLLDWIEETATLSDLRITPLASPASAV